MSRLWRDSPEKFAGREAWSEGLTKETDERLRRHSDVISASFDEGKIERYKELGKASARFLPHPSGSNHPSWKGGVATVYQMLYGSGRLYREWKFPILSAAGFSCVACGEGGRLNVHHDPIRMSEVVRDVCGPVDALSLSFAARRELCERVIDRHVDPARPIRGVCLCVGCHRLAHSIDSDVD